MLKHKFSGKRRAYIVTMRALMTLAALLTAALVLFIAFYPLESGAPAARSYAMLLRWFKWYNF